MVAVNGFNFGIWVIGVLNFFVKGFDVDGIRGRSFPANFAKIESTCEVRYFLKLPILNLLALRVFWHFLMYFWFIFNLDNVYQPENPKAQFYGHLSTLHNFGFWFIINFHILSYMLHIEHRRFHPSIVRIAKSQFDDCQVNWVCNN